MEIQQIARRWFSALFLSVSTLTFAACGEPTDNLPSDEVSDEVSDIVEPSAQVGSVTRVSTTKAELGRQVFFDTDLSEPPGLSCESCHQERAGFSDARGGPTSRGSLPSRVGARNAPTIFYAALIPPLHEEDGRFVGGVFVDGRVNTLEEQAGAPFVNPIEMGNPSVAAVMAKVRRARYAGAFSQLFGAAVLADDRLGFQAVTQALAAFQRGPQMLRFSSKYDAFLAGRVQLSPSEQRGLDLYKGKANCNGCHPSDPDPNTPGRGPLFTDLRYANIGTPKNMSNPFYTIDTSFNPSGFDFVDHGLARTVFLSAEDGKFRIPTLRNVARTAPYGHNGFFSSLHHIVNFYNTRNVGGWPAPEVPATIARSIGDLKLTPEEVDDVVAFLNTLTDQ